MFLLFLISFLNPLPIYADDFNIRGDSSANTFFQATTLTVEKFPEQGNISFNEDELFGQNTTNILDTQSVFTLTNMGYMRRIPNIADRVYGPPGTRVDILYFYQNNTGHSVDIKEIAIPVSRNLISDGDISKSFNIVTQEGAVPYLHGSNVLYRTGKFKFYESIGDIQDSQGGSILLDSWYIQNPLEIELLKVEKISSVINLKIKVKNITEDEYLSNLAFKHKEYEEVFALVPFEEKYLEYSLVSEENVLEPFSITNPNIKERCAILGGSYYKWYFTDSISVLVKRENDMWVAGGYVQPAVESMCIKRIGYKIASEEIRLDSGEILGIEDNLEKLPQTSKYTFFWLPLFVVLDVFLWYAFLRKKKKYENKNSDTGLCAKSR